MNVLSLTKHCKESEFGGYVILEDCLQLFSPWPEITKDVLYFEKSPGLNVVQQKTFLQAAYV